MIARDIAEALVSEIAAVASAECCLVSEIGKPVEAPALTHVRLATHDGSPADRLESAVGEIVTRQTRAIAGLVDRFVAGTLQLF